VYNVHKEQRTGYRRGAALGPALELRQITQFFSDAVKSHEKEIKNYIIRPEKRRNFTFETWRPESSFRLLPRKT
jgi:hypothetical protein